MKSSAELQSLAESLATLARESGCKGIIVALSDSDGEHSNFYVKHRGPCLEVEGLKDRVVATVATVWNAPGVTRS